MVKRTVADVLQDLVLHGCKWCGLFALSRFMTRGALRILCYHAFALRDEEVRFRPGLFISLPTFTRRLRTLKSSYSVIGLSAGLAALDRGALGSCSVVITIDDVFDSVATQAVPLLEQFAMTATGYVTTYYSVKQTPVFRLVVRYMLWKTRRQELVLETLDRRLSGTLRLDGQPAREHAQAAIIEFGEALPSEGERIQLSRDLGRLLDVDYEAIVAAKTYQVVSPAQIRELADAGIDIQLHTHRHRLPVVEAEVAREVRDNRAVLEPIVGRALDHLCYPRGIWSRTVWPWLASANIVSATTCDAGLNYSDTPRLGLKRILDAEDLPHIRFEAELAGFKPLLREVKRRIQRAIGRTTAESEPVARAM